MSKSLGNFFILKDILKKYHPEVLRYFVLTSHYRSPINFSKKNLDNAEAALRRFYITLRDVPSEEDIEIDSDNQFYKNFSRSMDDDFNTPKAISSLFDLVREINQLRDNKKTVEAERSIFLLKKLSMSLGLLQSDPNDFLKFGVDRSAIDKLIATRNQARKNKDWIESDKIRDQLTNMGIVLEDSKNGTVWVLEDKQKYLGYKQD